MALPSASALHGSSSAADSRTARPLSREQPSVDPFALSPPCSVGHVVLPPHPPSYLAWPVGGQLPVGHSTSPPSSASTVRLAAAAGPRTTNVNCCCSGPRLWLDASQLVVSSTTPPPFLVDALWGLATKCACSASGWHTPALRHPIWCRRQGCQKRCAYRRR